MANEPATDGGAALSPAQFGSAFKAFMDAMVAEAAPPASPLLERLRAHLETDPTQLPVIGEEFDAFEHPNVQVALDDFLAQEGRAAELVGMAVPNKRFMAVGLSDLLSWSTTNGRAAPFGPAGLAEGPVDYVNFHLAGGRVLPCVQFGLYLISTGSADDPGDGGDARLVAFVTGPTFGGPRPRLRVEVVGARREDCQAFLSEIMEGMRGHNVYRGHTISLSPGQMGMGPQTLVAFHSLPTIARDDVILPPAVLARIERHTVGFAERAEQLRAAGRSLKRGLLLYGPPGVGKTLTVMYLTGRMPGRTVILTTGRGMGMVQTVAQLARTLAPAMVVLEDVDLIGLERGSPNAVGPLLFELLNEMDGLADDRDVIFVLTTNRPDILEPALAARPGRIDLAVELPLPDAEGRRRLIELYARGLALRDVDMDAVVTRTEGVTPAYIKELLRKAALLAAAEAPSTADGVVVTDAHLAAAMDELNEGGRLAQRLLGFRSEWSQQSEARAEGGSSGGPGTPSGAPGPTGFPAAASWSAVVRRND